VCAQAVGVGVGWVRVCMCTLVDEFGTEGRNTGVSTHIFAENMHGAWELGCA